MKDLPQIYETKIANGTDKDGLQGGRHTALSLPLDFEPPTLRAMT